MYLRTLASFHCATAQMSNIFSESDLVIVTRMKKVPRKTMCLFQREESFMGDL